jgi:hypothetical protein
METTHEPLYLDKLSLVQGKITDIQVLFESSPSLAKLLNTTMLQNSQVNLEQTLNHSAYNSAILCNVTPLWTI